MIQMTKLHVGLLIVICSVEFIDASCLSYGHSCWGAHGKRSYTPQRESKPGELNDRWALFKIIPERNDFPQFKKLFRGNPNLQQQYQDNDIGRQLNFPPNELQLSSSSEEMNIINDDKDLNRNINPLVASAEMNPKMLNQRIPYADNVKPFQVMRLNKPNFEQ